MGKIVDAIQSVSKCGFRAAFIIGPFKIMLCALKLNKLGCDGQLWPTPIILSLLKKRKIIFGSCPSHPGALANICGLKPHLETDCIASRPVFLFFNRKKMLRVVHNWQSKKLLSQAIGQSPEEYYKTHWVQSKQQGRNKLRLTPVNSSPFSSWFFVPFQALTLHRWRG